jgi:hypothetical protein
MHNENKSKPTQTQTSEVTNLNLQDTQGITLAQSSGNTITTTDFGAIQAATDISHDAINLGRDAVSAGTDVAFAGLDHAQAAYQGGLNFASDIVTSALDTTGQSADRVARFATDALDSQSTFASEALASQTDTSTKAINALMDAGAGVLDFASSLFNDSLKAQSALADQNLAGLTTLATQNSASSDDRLQKVVIYIIVAAALVFLVPKVLK